MASYQVDTDASAHADDEALTLHGLLALLEVPYQVLGHELQTLT